tara:strand:+ start:315 stop:1181 length:867 start_codon:yes stop_codon:yes gene_type:complete
MENIHWIHQIPLPDGTVTPGVSRPAIDDFGLEEISVSEKRVLDIGCLDGLYTFYAEGRNAAEVVSIDILDEQFGPQNDKYNTGSGYMWAHKKLDSKAKYAFPFSLYNIPQLGKFDVIYCMGVLYHLAHPMLAIEQINKALNLDGMMVLETEVHATTHFFHHQIKNPQKIKVYTPKGLLHNFVAFIKLLPKNPVRTVRMSLSYIQLLMRASKKRGRNNDYITDPTVITVPSAENLEKMIDFGGFSIEKILIRGHRATYHCKKVSEVNSIFAGMGEQSRPEITNIPDLLK